MRRIKRIIITRVDFYVSKFALSMQIWQLYQVIMYIERTEEEKKKKKGKTNSFVVINQINYPSFNEDWCTNATFFLSLSLLLSTFVTSIADSSIHLSAHSSVMYLNHGTSKEESREMGQRNFYSYIYVPVFFFDSTIPFARNGRQDNHLFYFLPRLFKSCTMYIYLCIY